MYNAPSILPYFHYVRLRINSAPLFRHVCKSSFTISTQNSPTAAKFIFITPKNLQEDRRMAAKREREREKTAHTLVEARKFHQVKSRFKKAETPRRVFEIVRTAAGIQRRAAEINLSSASQTSPKTFGAGLAHRKPFAIRHP